MNGQRESRARGVTILGSTGSVGRSALAVIADAGADFDVVGLAAGKNTELLVEQAIRHRPQIVAVQRESDRSAVVERLAAADLADVEVVAGVAGAQAVAAATDADWVLTAMVGAVGLQPTLTAIRRGATVAIANKEPLVMAGALCTAEARRSGATVIPVDSEHSGLFQCIAGSDRGDLQRLVLTCSGGPLRAVADLDRVTVEQALAHPVWSMGKKISIDSATLVNKALEVIEAHWLFGVEGERIEVVIHPEGIVHALVGFRDGALLAQLSAPDMRLPIAYALAHPRRLPLDDSPIDLAALGALSFAAPDLQRFPGLALGHRVLADGGTAGAVLNAANEVAVERFLAGELPYRKIVALIERALDAHRVVPATDLDTILAADSWARAFVRSQLAGC
ncbi:MAG: 1-deoxy-D-xylulose-5-phosphate reductoisomerase [Deltaproteobacteria bacterium]|nr:1-deoxy-D-xylulose-5-phosphate reductoisomerase [Deltaproteobacteria bacterium]